MTKLMILLLVMGVVIISEVESACQCSDLTLQDHKGQTTGKCLSKHKGESWCYVPSNSDCLDKKASKRGRDIYWSADACDKEICPLGWISTITGCYKIIDSFTWTEGEINCKKAGGFLAEINSQEEQDTLWRVYQDSGLSLDHVYIGATDVAQEGTWLWVHSGTELTFTAWYSWEPNGGTRENCLIASTIPNFNFKWNDIPCDLRYEKSKAICESDRTG